MKTILLFCFLIPLTFLGQDFYPAKGIHLLTENEASGNKVLTQRISVNAGDTNLQILKFDTNGRMISKSVFSGSRLYSLSEWKYNNQNQLTGIIRHTYGQNHFTDSTVIVSTPTEIISWTYRDGKFYSVRQEGGDSLHRYDLVERLDGKDTIKELTETFLYYFSNGNFKESFVLIMNQHREKLVIKNRIVTADSANKMYTCTELTDSVRTGFCEKKTDTAKHLVTYSFQDSNGKLILLIVDSCDAGMRVLQSDYYNSGFRDYIAWTNSYNEKLNLTVYLSANKKGKRSYRILRTYNEHGLISTEKHTGHRIDMDVKYEYEYYD